MLCFLQDFVVKIPLPDHPSTDHGPWKSSLHVGISLGHKDYSQLWVMSMEIKRLVVMKKAFPCNFFIFFILSDLASVKFSLVLNLRLNSTLNVLNLI